MTNLISITESFRTVSVADGQKTVRVECPSGRIEIQNLGAIGQQGPQGETGPTPTGTTIAALTEISSLDNDDSLIIFDDSENVTRRVRLEDLKTFVNA